MTTPLHRRSFIKRAALLIAAPLLPKLAARPTPVHRYSPGLEHLIDQPLLSQEENARVLGAGIKVPANRVPAQGQPANGLYASFPYRYEGEWDGVSFKRQSGCTNPAYILADLYQRTGAEPDWVTGTNLTVLDGGCGAVWGQSTHLNWRMLYDYGIWCDQLAAETVSIETWQWHTITRKVTHERPGPRMTVNVVCQTPEHLVALRETLRMHCLSWQSTDPRYRTSWPGIPYPGEEHA